MERSIIGILFISIGIEALMDAIIAKPPAEWVPVWFYVGTLLLCAPFWFYWAVRVWRYGVA